MVFMTLSGLLLRLDIFGHKVGMHYRGEDAYRTKFGGLLSLATYVLVIIQTLNLVTDFVDHSAQTENFVRIKQDLVDQGEFSLHDQQLQIQITDSKKGIYPENIGKWKAYYLIVEDWEHNGELPPIEVSKCEDADAEVIDYWSKRAPNEETKEFIFDNLLCVGDQSTSIKGILGEKFTQYVVLEFEHCNEYASENPNCATA